LKETGFGWVQEPIFHLMINGGLPDIRHTDLKTKNLNTGLEGRYMFNRENRRYIGFRKSE